jgi:hypothetical protein
MAKNTKTKPVIAAASSTASDKPKRARQTVLIKKTPAELAALIGEDTPVGVSRKDLIVIRSKQIAADVGAEIA